MYLIDVQLAADKVTDEKIDQHRAWFKKHFQQGDFLIIGPSKSKELSGVILAKQMAKDKLNEIISQDAFYHDGGTYTVNEFTAKSVAKEIQPDE